MKVRLIVSNLIAIEVNIRNDNKYKQKKILTLSNKCSIKL
jgi:hypothetical protein